MNFAFEAKFRGFVGVLNTSSIPKHYENTKILIFKAKNEMIMKFSTKNVTRTLVLTISWVILSKTFPFWVLTNIWVIRFLRFGHHFGSTTSFVYSDFFVFAAIWIVRLVQFPSIYLFWQQLFLVFPLKRFFATIRVFED